MNFVKVQQIKEDIYGFLRIKEALLILPVFILIFRIFFSDRRASVFDFIALALLMLWRFYFCDRQEHILPKFLIVSIFLFMASDVTGAILSDNWLWQLKELRRYVFFFIGGILFTSPIDEKTRKVFIVFFLIASSISGIEGIRQYWHFGIYPDFRSVGSVSNPIIYAEILTVAWGTAIVLLIKKDKMSEYKFFTYFLLLVIMLTLAGILFSQTRGVWLGLAVATIVLLLLHGRRNALVVLLGIIVIISVTFYFSSHLRERAASIVTSVYTEDEKGSTGIRFELWKGALLIFSESPLLGVGTGNFDSSIERLTDAGRLKEMPPMGQAHNIFLQALATRGIIGFGILTALLASLIKWGVNETRQKKISGFIIIFVTTLTIIEGLTQNTIESGKYVAAGCFTIGLFGSLKYQGE